MSRSHGLWGFMEMSLSVSEFLVFLILTPINCLVHQVGLVENLYFFFIFLKKSISAHCIWSLLTFLISLLKKKIQQHIFRYRILRLIGFNTGSVFSGRQQSLPEHHRCSLQMLNFLSPNIRWMLTKTSLEATSSAIRNTSQKSPIFLGL